MSYQTRVNANGTIHLVEHSAAHDRYLCGRSVVGGLPLATFDHDPYITCKPCKARYARGETISAVTFRRMRLAIQLSTVDGAY